MGLSTWVRGVVFGVLVDLVEWEHYAKSIFCSIPKETNLSDILKTTTAKKAAPKAKTTATAEKTVKIAAPKKPAAKKAAPASKIALVPKAEPTHEQISRRAYEIWAGRGYSHGNPHHDWWQAEQELKRA
jgi:Protein of unknown function (DUF2934)